MHVLLRSIRNAASCQSRKHSSSSKSINDLLAAFKDASSPFHIPPGQKGPESPEPPQTPTPDPTGSDESKLQAAYEKLTAAGYDPASVWQQPIAWGDTDSFQHVNNVRYARFFESARMRWIMLLGNELGGSAKSAAMCKGHGVSLILKSIEIQFRRPVTFPDTLLVASRPLLPKDNSKDNLTVLKMAASAYSIAQGTFVAYSNETLVWYDYDKLKKCDPGETVREAVWRRIKKDHN